MQTIKILKKFYSVFGWIIISIFFILSTFSFVDRLTGFKFSLFGIRASYITSDSMASVHQNNTELLKGHDDRYYKNDLIFLKVINDPKKIALFDVVLFHSEQHHRLIVHRVIEIYPGDKAENYHFITKGDANSSNDALISFSNIKGVVINRVAKVGNILGYINSPYGLFSFFAIGTIFFGGSYLNAVIMSEKKKD